MSSSAIVIYSGKKNGEYKIMNVKHTHNRAFLILTSLWEVGESCRAGRYSCDRAEAARRVKRGWSGGEVWEGTLRGCGRGLGGEGGYIMGNARGIPRDSKSSPVRMRRAD